jgi:hypothetical protein
MQRKALFAILSVLLTLGLTAGVTAEEAAWLDMENCDICKHLSANMEMLDHMTWNHYNINNGIVSVTTVTADYAEAFGVAGKAMAATGKKMMAGEAVNLCNMCTAYNGMMMEGAAMEYVKTDFGNLRLTTSSDEAMVTKLHAWADKTGTEMAKMEAPAEKE